MVWHSIREICATSIKCLVVSLATLLIAAVPASGQSVIDQRWGVLAEMAEYDFETREGVLTVRWEVFNQTLVLTDWARNSDLASRFFPAAISSKQLQIFPI